jgi:alpha-1,2-mannosyltransferase
VAAALWIALHLVPQAAQERRVAYYSDFGRFYYSTSLFMQGQSMYQPVPPALRAAGQELRQRTDLTPPHAHLLLLPMAWLPIQTAFVAWIVFSLAALVWCVAAVQRELQLRPKVADVVLAGAALIFSAPFGHWFQAGQVSFVYGIPLILAWRAHRRGELAAAGAWLGILWSLKPFLGLFVLYFIVRREWRALLAGVASSAACYVVGILIFGVADSLGWLRDLGQVTWLDHPSNASVFGLVQRVTLAAGLGAGTNLLLRTTAAAIVSLGWLTALHRSASVDQRWLITVCAALLLSPLGWIYYAFWLLPAAVAVWNDVAHSRWKTVFVIGAATWFVPPEIVTLAGRSVGSVVSAGSIYMWGLLAIGTATLAVSQQNSAAQRSSAQDAA